MLYTQAGFSIHHAKPDYIMMTTWIHDSEPNHLPHYAGHYVGVGGFVVNERDELLVVQERFSPLGIKHWKLPGGHKDPGECESTIYQAFVYYLRYITSIVCSIDKLVLGNFDNEIHKYIDHAYVQYLVSTRCLYILSDNTTFSTLINIFPHAIQYVSN